METNPDALIEDKTSKSVAEEFCVSPRTVERAAQRAVVYDAMRDAGYEEAAELAVSAPQKVVSAAANIVRNAKKSADIDAKNITQNGVGKGKPKGIPVDGKSRSILSEAEEIALAAEQLKAYKNRNAGPRTPQQERAMTKSRAIKTIEASMRAVDDLHTESADKTLQDRSIRLLKEALGLVRGWNGCELLNPPF